MSNIMYITSIYIPLLEGDIYTENPWMSVDEPNGHNPNSQPLVSTIYKTPLLVFNSL